MSPSKSFRFKNEEDKKLVTDVCNKIADIHEKDISVQGDALVILAKAFQEGIETIQFREVPSSAQATLNQIKEFCSFIRYDGELSGYMCYEFFYKKKKGEPIGSIDELVIQRCQLCVEGKGVAKEKEIQKLLLKTNIKKLLDLREILISLTQDLSLAQIYMCKANLLEGHTLVLCIDGIHMECPIEDDDSVTVLEHCYNQVDPMTMNPPCRYLIDPHIKVKMDIGEKATEIIKDLVQIEHRPQEEIKQDAKIIEAEATVIEDAEPEEEIESEEAEKKEDE